MANLFLALFAAFAARADEVTICYNYNCHARARVSYSEAQLAPLQQQFAAAGDAAAERKAISTAIGRLYAIAGEQTPIWRDRGGNYADNGENGQMDCIDHSTNTDIFLGLLELHGWLRFHEVLAPIRRVRYLVSEHWAASVRDRKTRQLYAVDSWYFDNGRPALVLTVEDWRSGNTPDGV
jgi:hypothetical protein